jgi:ATP-dependent RNA helicase HelY
VSATTSRRRPGNRKEKSFPGQAGKNNLPLRKRVVKQLQPTEQPGQFQLDAFQTQAVAAVRANRSVLLAAPTGNGKTLVAEILAKDLIFNGKRMVYTSPLKALSNQKFRDFKKIFGEDQVGLVTGDVSVNSGAPLLIMTTEIFRNWCLSEQDQLTATVYVVFDEFHYLDDQDRGTTWEESILFAPPHVRFLGLSATVPNIKEIAAWVSAVRGDEVIIIEEHKRRVPLEICWLSPTGQIVTENEARQEVQDMVEYQKAFRNRKLWAEE